MTEIIRLNFRKNDFYQAFGAVFLGPNESLFIDFTPTTLALHTLCVAFTGVLFTFVWNKKRLKLPLRLRKMIFQSVKQAARKKNPSAPYRSRIHNLLAPVVQKVESAIHRINHYPLDNSIVLPNTYPLHGDLSGG